MSEATLQRVFDSLVLGDCLSNDLTVLWHAGEPLTVEVEYYERAFDIIRARIPPGVRVVHNFQTNGTLIDRRWANFFLDNHIALGVSIDGPKHLHDQHRRTRSDRGSFEQVMRGLRTLNETKVPFHLITVLTRESLRAARELFDFYVEVGADNVGFNIDEIEGPHTTSSLQADNVDHEIRSFFEQFYDLCESHPGRLRVREIDGAFHAIVDPESANYGNPLAEPFRMLNVAANGDLSTFSPELLGYTSCRHGSFAFGNIHNDDVKGILQNSSFRSVSAEIGQGLARCKSECEYFELCRGGAPVNKFFENGTFDSTETLFCRLTKKAVIDVVLKRLEVALNAA